MTIGINFQDGSSIEEVASPELPNEESLQDCNHVDSSISEATPMRNGSDLDDFMHELFEGVMQSFEADGIYEHDDSGSNMPPVEQHGDAIVTRINEYSNEVEQEASAIKSNKKDPDSNALEVRPDEEVLGKVINANSECNSWRDDGVHFTIGGSNISLDATDLGSTSTLVTLDDFGTFTSDDSNNEDENGTDKFEDATEPDEDHEMVKVSDSTMTEEGILELSLRDSPDEPFLSDTDTECQDENDDNYCAQHPSVFYAYICLDCAVGLCTLCFTTISSTPHADHLVQDISCTIEHIKSTAKTHLGTLRKSEMENLTNWGSKMLIDIDTRACRYISMIHQWKDEQIETVQNITSKESQLIESNRHNWISTLARTKLILENICETTDEIDFEIIRLLPRVEKEMQYIDEWILESEASFFLGEPGNVDLGSIKESGVYTFRTSYKHDCA